MIRKGAISAAHSSLIRRVGQSVPLYTASTHITSRTTSRITSSITPINHCRHFTSDKRNHTTCISMLTYNGASNNIPTISTSPFLIGLDSTHANSVVNPNTSWNTHNVKNPLGRVYYSSTASTMSDYDNDNDHIDNNYDKNNNINDNNDINNDNNNNNSINNLNLKNRTNLINATHDILKNTDVGSMSIKQINTTKSLLYAWSSTLSPLTFSNSYSKNSTSNSNNLTSASIHNNKKKQRQNINKARDVASIMETLLERLIIEYDDGLNEDALLVLTNKDYNVVMNAYGKSANNYYANSASKYRKRNKNKQRNRHQQGDDYDDDDNYEDDEETHESILKAEALFQRMKDRYEEYDNLYANTTNATATNSNGGNVNGPYERIPPKPDIISYNTLLSAYSNQYNSERSVRKAEEIVSFLESNSQHYDENDNDKADGTRKEIDQRNNNGNMVIIQPNTITYNVLMNIYANQIGEYGYAQKAEDMLLKMTKLRKEGSELVIPDTTSFNIVLKAWKNSGGGGGIESAKRAEEILRIMIKLNLEGHDNVKPDGASLSTVINAYAEAGNNNKTNNNNNLNEETIRHFDAIIDLLLNEAGDDFTLQNSRTVLRTFNTIIDRIAKSNIDNVGERANYFLQRLIDVSLQPDRVTLSNVIGAYVKSNDIEKAMTILNDMTNGEESTTTTRPDVYCFNKCLYHYCKKEKNVKAAEDLYNKMCQLATTTTNGDDYATPTRRNNNKSNEVTMIDYITYNMMMDMYLEKSKKKKGSELKKWTDKALTLLKEMEDAYASGILKSLDIYPYEVVLERLQKLSAVRIKSGTSQLAHDMLMKMIELHFDHHLPNHPDTMSCNVVLSTLTREYTVEAAEMATALLDHMEQMHKDGKNVCPDEHSFNHTIVCWVRSGAADAPTRIMTLFDKMINQVEQNDITSPHLDKAIFETILHGLSNKSNGDRKLAKTVIERMISLSKVNDHCHPTSTCLNLAIKAECLDSNRNPGEMAAFDVHRLLFNFIKRYESGEINVLPDVIGFNTAISKWALTRHNQTIFKADEIMKAMERLSNQKGLEYVKPDTYTYSTLLKVYAKSNRREASKKAENLVHKIEQSYNDGDVQLDTYTYNGMLNVWATSRHPDKASKARQMLDVMLTKNDIVDVSGFNITIKACAHTRGGVDVEKSALDLALQTYDELLDLSTSSSPSSKSSSKRIKANTITFATMIKAIHNLSRSKEEREQYIKRIFDDCCNHGMLSDMVLTEIKYAIPEKDRLEVFGYDLKDKTTFDKEWNKNAR